MRKNLLAVLLYLTFIGSVLFTVIYYFYFYSNQKRCEEVFTKMKQEVKEQQDGLHKVTNKQILNYKSKQHKKEEQKISEKKTHFSLSRLTRVNQDVYGWIEIPGTNISYPILQNEKDDYYLLHNINHSLGYPGCIYSNKLNEKTFSDEMTVLYGHNMKNGTMFGSLRQFRSTSFFEKNQFIYIYTENKINVYEILAVQEWGDRDILNQYNAKNLEEREVFLKKIASEHAIQLRYIDSLKKQRLLVLSTCMRGKKHKRLLVIAHLI